MAPSEYIAACENGDKSNEFYKVMVDERPYFPFFRVENEDSIRLVASLLVNDSPDYSPDLAITKISGGITNQLYRVSGLQHKSHNDDAVLIRLFGAEGMIDRHVENATYAALARQGFAPAYFGRFANGRVEQWLDAKPLDVREMGLYSTQIAQALGHLHAQFQVPPHLQEYHDSSKPALWMDLHSWMKQALDAKFQNDRDAVRAAALRLPQVAQQLEWLESHVIPAACAETCFCHNDVLAANILKLNGGDIQLIDFEYGGINFKAFDIANHFNEYAGGTDTGIPNYKWVPTEKQQFDFIQQYMKASSASESIEFTQVKELMEQVQAFIMLNHLYWGLWAVNQASTEGCSDFDYLLYASNRIQQYYKCKEAHHAMSNE
jgi:ethanolamine kinase